MDRMTEEGLFLEIIEERIKQEIAEQQELLESTPLEYRQRYAQAKWGDEDLISNFSQMRTKRIAILKSLVSSPYFGRIDFLVDGKSEPDTYYIGKSGVNAKGYPMVLDWRNPICSLFYENGIGRASYESPGGTITGQLLKKSQIIIKDGKLISVKDFDLMSADEALDPFLSVNADDRMKIIIASIQKEQDAIIRKSINSNIIIQGVAGSGKTSVALHRIAYALYNHAKSLTPSQYAIIGPNKFFLNYISSILPDLDTQPIDEYTFEDIAKRIIGRNDYIYESANDEMNSYIATNQERSKVKKIKGSIYYRDSLIRFVNNYITSCLIGGLKYDGIEVASFDYLRNAINYRPGYGDNIKTIFKNLIKKIKSSFEDIYYPLSAPLMKEMIQYPVGDVRRNPIIAKKNKLEEAVKNGFANEIKLLMDILLISPIELYKLFLENADKYIQLNPEELKEFNETSLNMLKNHIIPYEDLTAIAFLSMMYYGQNETEKYRHVVIDEAQDYSVFQLDFLKSLFKNSTFSIFGDLAQSIYSYRSIESWDDVLHQLFDGKADQMVLSKSYRTTKEITNNANYVLKYLDLDPAEPVIREGSSVEYTELNASEREIYYSIRINEFLKKGYKSIGIICKTEEEIRLVATILKKIHVKFNLIKGTDKEYKPGVSVLPCYLAKGLEFDGIIINDASSNVYDPNSNIDMHLLYVALTRALHELDIIYTGSISLPLNNQSIYKRQ